MRSQRSRRRHRAVRAPRRGIALFVSLFFVAGVGALALSAIYLNANATLLGQTYEKEDNLRYAAEAALAIGKAELNFNPAALPNSSYVQVLNHYTLKSADSQSVSGVYVNLYIGPTGSTSGQFGRFASVVAEARDPGNGTGFVRRLELDQESFAKYAYWTNSEGSGIVFGGGDELWGPVWSNDSLTIVSSGAHFHDVVGTAKNIGGVSFGTFDKGYQTNQKPIPMPDTAKLSGQLPPLAAEGGMSFTPPTTGSDTLVRMRVEFVSVDLDGNGDSTETDEGFFKIYTAKSGQQKWLRADWPGAGNPALMNNCGDWHRVHPTDLSAGTDTGLKFFPFASHVHISGSNTAKSWFDTVVAGGMIGGANTTNIAKAHAEADSLSAGMTTAKATKVYQHTGSRCYLGGDPHLVSVARTNALGYSDAQIHKGGDDTTFTATDQYGAWTLYNSTPMAALATARPGDAKYLQPLYRGYNTHTKGVMYFNGTVGISGTLRGDITLYTPYNLVILDDVRYANDPAKGVCIDILGTISGLNTVIADNSLNDPASLNGSSTYKSMDETPDLYLQDVVMALGTGFTVQNYNSGPTTADPCQGTAWGRGCLFLTGGLIQKTRGAVGTTGGTGYLKRYQYDRCAVINPPPYFPTTGRFMDNRYYEINPVNFDIAKLFQQLTPKS